MESTQNNVSIASSLDASTQGLLAMDSCKLDHASVSPSTVFDIT